MGWRGAVLGVVALVASGCGRPEPAGPPVRVERSEVERLVYWSHDLDGRRVSMQGFIGFDNGPNGQAIAMGPELTSAPNGGGDELIRVEVERGGGPSQLNLPVLSRQRFAATPAVGEFLTVDIGHATYQDKAGVAHPLGDPVRVTGRLSYARLNNVGPLSDPDPRSPTGQRFNPRLVDVELEAP